MAIGMLFVEMECPCNEGADDQDSTHDPREMEFTILIKQSEHGDAKSYGTPEGVERGKPIPDSPTCMLDILSNCLV
ncbi:hypothetical protein MA05_07850 [Comamonas aquatica]|nr:hypothetical protein MA05_07850 [Comamonas aquatica]